MQPAQSFISLLVLTGFLWLLGVLFSSAAKTDFSRTILFLIGCFASIPAFLFALYYFHFFDSSEWYFKLRILNHSEFLAAGVGFLGGVIRYDNLVLSKRKPSSFLTIFVIGVILFVPYMKPLLRPLNVSLLRSN